MLMRFLVLLLLLSACRSIPRGDFQAESNNRAPDYDKLENWAASPLQEDNADLTPGGIYQNEQETAEVDVFFLHPTSYTKERGNTEWNGRLDDIELNEKTDEGAILFQASVFNGAAKVYAPRYRQAHIYVYFTEEQSFERKAANRALAVAYEDVKSSFEHYMEKWNNGRPVIIASHSQGTTHAIQLIKDYFDGKPLAEKLVAAYLVGMPVRESEFEQIHPCTSGSETGCSISWRTYQKGHLPKWKDPSSDILVTNPLSWKTDEVYVPASENDGTVLFNFEKGVTPGIADAQKHKGHLWVTKPKFRGSVFMTFKNYHIADYNLFYADIRSNVSQRVKAYLESEKQ